MPSIEISDDQAAALARGEDVVLTAPEPPKPEKLVAIRNDNGSCDRWAGSVYLITEVTKRRPDGDIEGFFVTLRRSDETSASSTQSAPAEGYFHSQWYTFVEVSK